MNSVERWLPVVGYEGLYSVSDRGRIRSEARIITTRRGYVLAVAERILRQQWHRDGHRLVSLQREGRKMTHQVHRIVVTAFIGQVPRGMHTCHNDGDPSNNCVENLRIDTPSANEADKIRHGTHPHANRNVCKHGHELTPDNIYVPPKRPHARYCLACRDIRNRARKGCARAT